MTNYCTSRMTVPSVTLGAEAPVSARCFLRLCNGAMGWLGAYVPLRYREGDFC
jgi:hypothetical protein